MNRLPLTTFLAGAALLAAILDIRLHQLRPGPTDNGGVNGLEAAAVADPASVNAWVDLAEAYADAGRGEDAARVFERARRLDPQNSRVVHSALASAHWVSDVEREVLSDPLNDESWGHVGSELLDQGQPAQAIPYFLEALRLDPDDSEWPGKLAACGDDPRIDAWFDAHVSGTDDEAIGDRADGLWAAGRTDRACELYARALTLDPGDSEWQGDVSRCAQTDSRWAGQAEAAMSAGLDAQGANLVTSTDDEAIGDYADALWAANRTDEACAQWKRALSLDPSDSEWPQSLLRCPGYVPPDAGQDDEKIGDLGDALSALGRRSEACEQYNKALQIDPADDEWRARVNECNGQAEPFTGE
jgi:tetratricopeptide (TPR) repeat protein